MRLTTMNTTRTLLTSLLLAPLAALHAAAPQLKVGDLAPPLKVSQWAAGTPIGSFEAGRVYVVEFWATWCAPCIAAMPHLAELQRKHEKGGLTVIAVAVKDEAKAVKDFVAKRASDWNHPVATDDAEGFMAKHWLDKSGREGIPQTFLVDRKGSIVWIGHPMRVDGPLAAVLAGTFDPARQQQVDAAFAELDVKLGEALRTSRWREVLAVLDEMNRADPASAPLNYATKVKALLQLGKQQDAQRFAKEVAPTASESIVAHLASALLKAPEKHPIDHELVISLAQQAIKSGGARNPVALSALARAYEGQGKVEGATRAWQQMLALDDPSIDKDNVRKRLASLTGKSSAATPPTTKAMLGPGDPAPALKAHSWIQGEPVQALEKGKAYLLDFWATWCGPCVASIPHIEHLHQKYKDQGLVVIGQNVWEDDTGKIRAFVEKVANKMTYRIALDSQEAVAKPWLRAAGQNGIPVVILVGKDGKIAWIDHPEALSETVVEQVLAGTFDLAKEKRLQQVRGKFSESYHEAFGKFQTTIKARNWADAQVLLDRMKSIVPAEDTEWRAVIRKQQFTLLVAKGEDDEAIKLGESILTDEKQNSGSADSLVWVITHAENPSAALLKFAETCAMQANGATRGQYPRILENLARLHFRQGNRREAIQCQEQAIDRATSPDEEKRLRDGLAAYQKGQLPAP